MLLPLVIGIVSSCERKKKSVSKSNLVTITCPENYVPIPKDPSVDTTSHLCVAKFKMKQVTGKLCLKETVPPG
jgi:hypothetical protein